MATEQQQNKRSTETIPVVEEQLSIGVKTVETDRIRIRKTVVEEVEDVPLTRTHTEYTIERVPVNKAVQTPPPPYRYEGETMVLPVLEEETVIIKQFRIIEEVRITPKHSESTETQQVSLKKEKIHIQRDAEENKK